MVGESGRLKYLCDICGGEVDPVSDEAYLDIPDEEVRKAEEGQQLWEESRKQHPLFSLAELAEHLQKRPPARWRVTHFACCRKTSGYHLKASEIATWRKLVDTTAHLLEKVWLPATNWSSFLYEVLKKNPEALG